LVFPCPSYINELFEVTGCLNQFRVQFRVPPSMTEILTNFLLGDTVPSTKFLLDGTILSTKFWLDGSVLLAKTNVILL
jgi:hypothetical protein